MEAIIVTGIFTLAGAVLGAAISQLGSYFLADQSKSTQRAQLLRAKYEEVSDSLIQLDLWYHHVKACRSRDQLNEFFPNLGIRKAYTLSLVYFPEFQELSAKALQSASTLWQCYYSCMAERPSGTAYEAAVPNALYEQRCQDFLNKKFAFEKAIQDKAVNYAAKSTPSHGSGVGSRFLDFA